MAGNEKWLPGRAAEAGADTLAGMEWLPRWLPACVGSVLLLLASALLLGGEHGHVAAEFEQLRAMYGRQLRTGDFNGAYRTAAEMQKLAEGPLRESKAAVAVAMNCLGTVYSLQGRYAEAEKCYKRAIDALGRGNPKAAELFNNLGGVYLRQGRYTDAEVMFGRALGLLPAEVGRRHARVATACYNVAVTYHLAGDYRQAEWYYNESADIFRSLYGDKAPDVALTRSYLARLYADQKRYVEAKRLCDQALRDLQRVFGRSDVNTAPCHSDLGEILTHTGEFAEADEHLAVAVRALRESPWANSAVMAMALTRVASLRLKQGRFQEAQQRAKEAVGIWQRRLEPARAWQTYLVRGRVNWKVGRKDKAIADLRHAIELVEGAAEMGFGEETSRERFYERCAPLYEQMLEWQVEQGQIERAFDTLERARARVLLEQIRAHDTDCLAGLKPAEVQFLLRKRYEAERRLSKARRDLDRLERADTDSPAQRQKREKLRAELEAELERARELYFDARAAMRDRSPAYRRAFGRDHRPVTLEKLKKWVSSRRALLLEYLVGERASYLFVVDGKGVGGKAAARFEKLTVDPALAGDLGLQPGMLTAEELRRVLENNEGTGVIQLLAAEEGIEQHDRRAVEILAALWKLLIPRRERKSITWGDYDRLIVIPDGVLARLPYEALVTKPGNPAECEYLLDITIEDDRGLAVSYAPSATVLLDLAQGPTRQGYVLSVGDCRYPPRPARRGPAIVLRDVRSVYSDAFQHVPSKLPFSGVECDTVLQQFEAQGANCKALVGDRATEANVRLFAAGCKVLHLSCHGGVDQAYGNLFGALALTPGPDPGRLDNDGFLTLNEIYELDLKQCELAILSACDTNRGPHQRGDGVWTLARGFLVAGARRVVASNWTVDDFASKELVSQFCRGLHNGDYAAALVQAKRHVRHMQGRKSPHFWASMVLIGPSLVRETTQRRASAR